MAGYIEGQMNVQIDKGITDGQMNGQIDKGMKKRWMWMDDRRTKKLRMDGIIDGWMDNGMNNVWMNDQINDLMDKMDYRFKKLKKKNR